LVFNFLILQANFKNMPDFLDLPCLACLAEGRQGKAKAGATV